MSDAVSGVLDQGPGCGSMIPALNTSRPQPGEKSVWPLYSFEQREQTAPPTTEEADSDASEPEEDSVSTNTPSESDTDMGTGLTGAPVGLPFVVAMETLLLLAVGGIGRF